MEVDSVLGEVLWGLEERKVEGGGSYGGFFGGGVRRG